MRILLLVDIKESEDVWRKLLRKGFELNYLDNLNELINEVEEGVVDVILMDIDIVLSFDNELIVEFKNCLSKSGIPAIALVSEKSLSYLAEDTFFVDFVVKPFHAEELLVRIYRSVKNRKHVFKEEKTIRCGDLLIDTERCKVVFKGKTISLTFKEYELLKLLVLNKGKVFRREELLSKLWGYDYYGGDRTVDTHISRLRNKLGDYDHKYIQTVRNIGYKFVEEDEET